MKKILPILTLLVGCGGGGGVEGTYTVSGLPLTNTCGLDISEIFTPDEWKVQEDGGSVTLTTASDNSTVVLTANGSEYSKTVPFEQAGNGCTITGTALLKFTVVKDTLTGSATIDLAGACIPSGVNPCKIQGEYTGKRK